MKKVIAIFLAILALILSGCNENSIGIIGGADGPTAIYVKERFGEMYEKKPLRMINADGELYYDSGLKSDMTLRCGTLDGHLKNTAEIGEIPKNGGEANFEAEGYQSVTGITKEIPLEEGWVIFKKFDGLKENQIGKLKYCFYIRGRLNNAVNDSEIIVLSEYEDVTFNDIYEPILGSKYSPENKKGHIAYNIISKDKWGLTLMATDVTNKGMTLEFHQFGGEAKGELDTGEWFKIERIEENEWKELDTNPLIDYAWNSVAYTIKKNDITTRKTDWEWLYGTLSPGFYRLSKEVMDFKGTGNFDKEIYQVYFTIE